LNSGPRVPNQRRDRALYCSLKYEHLYRHEIFDGLSVADLVDGYRDV
jgi:hypothetical protein